MKFFNLGLYGLFAISFGIFMQSCGEQTATSQSDNERIVIGTSENGWQVVDVYGIIYECSDPYGKEYFIRSTLFFEAEATPQIG